VNDLFSGRLFLRDKLWKRDQDNAPLADK